MTMIQEAPFRIPGAKRLDLNEKYAIDMVYGSEYRDNVEELIKIAVDFDVGKLHPTRPLAEKMVRRAMEMPERVTNQELETPSAQFFIEKDPDDPNDPAKGKLVGLSTEQVFLIHTTVAGIVPFLYLSKRIFISEARGLHLGRIAIQQGRVIHREATWGGHRTNTDIAGYSFANAGSFEEGRLYPYDSLADGDPLSQELVSGLWWRVRINAPQPPNISTFIAQAEYDVQNTANLETPPHVRVTQEFLDFRERLKSYGFRPERRDAIYGIGKFR